MQDENILFESLRERLGFCACGQPEECLVFIKKLLDLKDKRFSKTCIESGEREYKEYEEKFEALFDEHKYHVQYIIEYLLSDKNITGHGHGVIGSWVEDKEFKKDLDLFAQEYEKELESEK